MHKLPPTAPLIVLKIDVDTYRGTREGVPNLVRLFQQHAARATFLFSLGPDHTGRAMKRVFRPGFFSKVSRTSVVEHYGLKTLLYGTLLPGPDIGRRCANEMRATQAAGFECGIHTWDHILWHDQVRHQNAAWTTRQMQQSAKRFANIFGHAPATHGAAGWQMNPQAFTELDNMGIQYASDGRAELNAEGELCPAQTGPYRLQNGQNNQNGQNTHYQCIQIPTTLPTLDEILGLNIGGDVLHIGNVAQHLLKLTRAPRNHVYTLHAELEGQKLAPVMAELLTGWRAQGYRFATMGDYYQTLDPATLPLAPIRWGELPGRSGELLLA